MKFTFVSYFTVTELFPELVKYLIGESFFKCLNLLAAWFTSIYKTYCYFVNISHHQYILETEETNIFYLFLPTSLEDVKFTTPSS